MGAGVEALEQSHAARGPRNAGDAVAGRQQFTHGAPPTTPVITTSFMTSRRGGRPNRDIGAYCWRTAGGPLEAGCQKPLHPDPALVQHQGITWPNWTSCP
jgi:hypothetical protein